MGFSIFPLRISQVGKWQSQKVDLSQRPVSLVEVEVEGRDISDGCKAWLQSGKFQSRFPSVTPELSDRPAGTVSYPGPVLELPASPARPGPGHFCQTVRTLTVLHTTTSHISSHSLQHSILKQISYSGEIWWIGNLRILLLLLGISGHWSVVISHWKIVEG